MGYHRIRPIAMSLLVCPELVFCYNELRICLINALLNPSIKILTKAIWKGMYSRGALIARNL